MFTAALLTRAKIQKQLKCPWTDEWLKKMRYIYTVEYYSAQGKEETLSFVTTWMDLEGIKLSEINETKIQILYDLTYTWNLKKLNSQKQKVEWRV